MKRAGRRILQARPSMPNDGENTSVREVYERAFSTRIPTRVRCFRLALLYDAKRRRQGHENSTSAVCHQRPGSFSTRLLNCRPATKTTTTTMKSTPLSEAVGGPTRITSAPRLYMKDVESARSRISTMDDLAGDRRNQSSKSHHRFREISFGQPRLT